MHINQGFVVTVGETAVALTTIVRQFLLLFNPLNIHSIFAKGHCNPHFCSGMGGLGQKLTVAIHSLDHCGVILDLWHCLLVGFVLDKARILYALTGKLCILRIGAGCLNMSQYWCWVNIGHKFLSYRLLVFYAWLWLAMIVSFLGYLPLYFWKRGYITCDPAQPWWRIHFQRHPAHRDSFNMIWCVQRPCL